MDCMEKYENLLAALKKYGKLCIAYSGGADSTLLLKAGLDALSKENVIAAIADTVFFSDKETAEAKELAEGLGALCCVVNIDVLYLPQIANNENNRCYHCKTIIFTNIAKAAYTLGFKTIADGRIVDNKTAYQPGRAAADELGVVSPLYECGINKNDVREISERLGLPTWNKPTNSCLATRFPHDTEITKNKLETISEAEEFLSSYGTGVIRLRTHGNLARIEVGEEDFDRFIGKPEIVSRIKEFGFRYVTLDLEGYRTGSMDEEE